MPTNDRKLADALKVINDVVEDMREDYQKANRRNWTRVNSIRYNVESAINSLEETPAAVEDAIAELKTASERIAEILYS